jgi:hypothetical protein
MKERKKVFVDSGQILIIKKELVKDFVIDKYVGNDEEDKKKIEENKELKACYSDCCALTAYSEDRTKVTNGVFCVNTLEGDGKYIFEVNPSGTECYGNFIGFTEEETGFDYTYDNKYEGDDPDEDPSEYVGYDDSTGIVEIEEEGYYIIGDPCSISEEDTEVYLKEGEYKICFFSNREDY